MQGVCLPISPQGPAVTHDSRSSAPGQNLTVSFTQAQDSGWASKSIAVISSPSMFEPWVDLDNFHLYWMILASGKNFSGQSTWLMVFAPSWKKLILLIFH